MMEIEFMIDFQYAVNQVSIVQTQHVNQVSLVALNYDE